METTQTAPVRPAQPKAAPAPAIDVVAPPAAHASDTPSEPVPTAEKPKPAATAAAKPSLSHKQSSGPTAAIYLAIIVLLILIALTYFAYAKTN